MKLHLFPWTLVMVLLASRLLITPANAAPADDMRKLQTACETAASELDASVNDTRPMNTSDIIQSIMWQLGASKANLALLNTTTTTSQSSPTITTTTLTNSTLSTPLDEPYFSYIDSLATLSIAALHRGSTFHPEPSAPVYSALQGLATGVQAYGLALRNAGLISSRAQVRTFMAGSTLVDAARVWGVGVVYPD